MGTLKVKPQYFLYLLPAIALFTIFFIMPFFQTVYFSLLDWDGINEQTFVGISNYIEMFKNDVFLASIGRVLKWAVIQCVVQVTVALFLANLLKDNIRGARFFRSVYFLPVIISSAAICVMFVVMYDKDIGLINGLLRAVGLGKFAKIWLADNKTAFYAAIAVPIWQSLGMYLVILLAGIQGISEEYFEAARIDGASAFKVFTKITFPILWPITQICIILSVSSAFKNFDYIYILTGGGPGSSTHVLATFMYDKAFIAMRYGYGSAVAVFIFMLGFIFTVVFKFFTSRNKESGQEAM